MSYRYQLAGVYDRMLCFGLIRPEAPFKNLDYSHGRMCTLNENSLNEKFGSGMIWTDFDGNDVLSTSLPKDLSQNRDWCTMTGNRTTISDYPEWTNLVDGALLAHMDTPEAQQELQRRQRDIEMEPCISYEEAWEVENEIAALGCPSCSQATLETESCLGGKNVYLGTEVCPFGICIRAGTCSYPYGSVQSAHNAFPSNSVFYLAPKTYDEPGSVLLTRRGLYTCDRKDGSGSALIK